MAQNNDDVDFFWYLNDNVNEDAALQGQEILLRMDK
jgi:hypothetical protein